MDPRIEKKMDKVQIGRAIKVALCCLHEEPCFRPSMKAMAAMLDRSIEVWEPRVKSLCQLIIESINNKSACKLPSFVS